MAASRLGAHAEAERIARDAYGRLLASLAARTRDISAAEDALSDALEKALRLWPSAGIPQHPEAWVLAVARNHWLNKLRDEGRRPQVAVELLDEMDAQLTTSEADAIPDSRLGLMFACAHPAIDPEVRTPLMLQAVLGLQVHSIARAFGMPAATLAQRLVRAKRRIRDARIPLEVPSSQRLERRLPDVLEAVYAAFAIDWDNPGSARGHDSLTREALYLATLLTTLLPDEPEVLGLAALICLTTSRQEARRDADGRVVALTEQDCARWDRDLIRAGEAYLHRAHAHGRPARFQIEAAIQSLHCARANTGCIDGASLLTLHRALVSAAPSAGAQVALAVVMGDVLGAAQGLEYLARCEAAQFVDFQPYWASRAALSARVDDHADARASLQRAIALSNDPATRQSLEAKLSSLSTAAPASPGNAPGWPQKST
jgi:predicted RNA polymerase sigma factor